MVLEISIAHKIVLWTMLNFAQVKCDSIALIKTPVFSVWLVAFQPGTQNSFKEKTQLIKVKRGKKCVV